MSASLRYVSRGRVSPRQATYFLCFAKESKQRKATPLSASLRFAAGNLRCSRFAGSAELASLKQLRPLSASRSAPRRSQRGGESSRAFASLGPYAAAGAARLQPPPAERSDGAFGFQIPSGCAEERSGSRIRARPCLSEASLGGTPRNASTAGCPKRSVGTQTVGSPFFCLRFFGEAKKSRSPAGARPGLGKQTKSTVQKIGRASCRERV